MRMSRIEFEKIFEHYPDEIQDICWAVRDLVFEVVPTACEWSKMGGVGYFLEENSSSLKGMICHMTADYDRVKIGFIFGAFMDDPEGLLEGNQKAKRFLFLSDYEQIPWERVKGLIGSAAKIDPAIF